MRSLDWSNINNPTIFHKVCNDLLMAELGVLEYIPGDPNRGADRGLDGFRYRGMVGFAPEKIPGTWAFQAKYTKHDGKSAANWLKRQLMGTRTEKGEITKVRERGDDYLVLLTRASLDADQVIELEKLWPDRLHVMARLRIEPLLKNKAWLRHEYFGDPLVPTIVPEAYYKGASASLGLAPLPFVGRGEDIARLAGAITNSSVVLLHAPGGTGKSRLLHEFARTWPTMSRDRRPLYFSTGARVASDVLTDEFEAQEPGILIADDADRDYVRDVQPFVRALVHGTSKVALVLAARSGAHQLLEDALVRDKAQVSMLRIAPLPSDERRLLISKHTNLDEEDVERLDRHTAGNLFLLTYAISAIAAGRQRIFDGVDDVGRQLVAATVNQARAALETHGLPFSLDFLPALAILTPLSLRDAELPPAIAAICGFASLTSDQYRSLVEVLLEAAVLRRVGEQIRFSSDVVGDLVLAERLARPTARSFIDVVFDRSLSFAASRVFYNIAAANADATRVRTAVDAVVSGWLDSIATTPLAQRRERLGLFVHVCQSRGSTALAYIEACARVPAPAEPPITLPGFRNLNPTWKDSLSTDDIGPLVLRLGHEPTNVVALLRMLRRLSASIRVGTYDNYKPTSVVSTLHSIFHVPDDTITSALAELETWAQEADLEEPAVQLILSAISTVLASNIRVDRYVPKGLVLQTWAVPVVPSVQVLRRKAIELLCAMIRNPSRAARLAVPETIHEIGHSLGMGGSNPALEPLAAAERKQAYEALAQELRSETRLDVLAAAHQVLFNSWLFDEEPREVVVRALRTFPRTLEFRATLWTLQPYSAVDDFSEIERHAQEQGLPGRKRYEWWHDTLGHTYTRGHPAEEQLTREILTACSTPTALVDFLVRLADLRPRGIPNWLNNIGRHDSGLIAAIHGDHALFSRVPQAFRVFLDDIWLFRCPEALQEVRGALPGNLALAAPDAALRYLLLVLDKRVEVVQAREALLQLAGHAHENIRIMLVERLGWNDDLSVSDRLLILATIVRTRPSVEAIKRLRDAVLYGKCLSDTISDRHPMREAVLVALRDHETSEETRRLLDLLYWSVGDSPQEIADALLSIRAQVRDFPCFLFTAFARIRHRRGRPPISFNEIDVGRFLTLVLESAPNDGWSRSLLQQLAACAPKATLQFTTRKTEAGLRQEDVPRLAALLSGVPFEASGDLWLVFTQQVLDLGLSTDIEADLAYAAGNVREWSGTVGEDPPQLTSRRDAIERFLELRDKDLDPRIRAALCRAREYIEASIEHHRARDEEFMDPR